MPSELACHRCNRRLRVTPDAESRWLTCPRCLASVRNPHFSGQANPVLDAAPIAIREVEVTGKVCPTCGHDVKSDWHFCPYCEQSLRPRSLDVRRGTLSDDDAAFDRRGANVGLVLVGLLLIIGVVAFLGTGGLWRMLNLRDPRSFIGAGMVLLVAVIGGLLAIGAGLRDESARGWSQMFGCFMTGAGMTCILIFASCIGLLSVCAGH
jgi:hypothetical protein